MRPVRTGFMIFRNVLTYCRIIARYSCAVFLKDFVKNVKLQWNSYCFWVVQCNLWNSKRNPRIVVGIWVVVVLLVQGLQYWESRSLKYCWSRRNNLGLWFSDVINRSPYLVYFLFRNLRKTTRTWIKLIQNGEKSMSMKNFFHCRWSISPTYRFVANIRIPTVKLKIPGKAFVKSESRTFDIFHIFFMVADLRSLNRCNW